MSGTITTNEHIPSHPNTFRFVTRIDATAKRREKKNEKRIQKKCNRIDFSTFDISAAMLGVGRGSTSQEVSCVQFWSDWGREGLGNPHRPHAYATHICIQFNHRRHDDRADVFVKIKCGNDWKVFVAINENPSSSIIRIIIIIYFPHINCVCVRGDETIIRWTCVGFGRMEHTYKWTLDTLEVSNAIAKIYLIHFRIIINLMIGYKSDHMVSVHSGQLCAIVALPKSILCCFTFDSLLLGTFPLPLSHSLAAKFLLMCCVARRLHDLNFVDENDKKNNIFTTRWSGARNENNISIMDTHTKWQIVYNAKSNGGNAETKIKIKIYMRWRWMWFVMGVHGLRVVYLRRIYEIRCVLYIAKTLGSKW